MKEVVSNKRIATIAMVAALGNFAACSNSESAVSPNAKKVVCDPSRKITQIIKHLKNNDTFPWEALKSGESKRLVNIEPKPRKASDGFNEIANPLVLRCAGKIVGYIGVTSYKHDTPGKQYVVRDNQNFIKDDLYLNVAKPANVHISSDGGVKSVTHLFKEEIIHPISQTNIPAFVRQPVATDATDQQIANQAFGFMVNGL